MWEWPNFKMAAPINVLTFSQDIIAREQMLAAMHVFRLLTRPAYTHRAIYLCVLYKFVVPQTVYFLNLI